jgi:hypothetical protein
LSTFPQVKGFVKFISQSEAASLPSFSAQPRQLDNSPIDRVDVEPLKVLPPWRSLMANPKMMRRICVAVTKSLIINGLLTALVIGPGLWLMSQSQLLGLIWMFVGASCLMARTYAKPWRMMVITTMIPAVASLSSYGVQYWLFSQAAPPMHWVAIAMALGMVVGAARAFAHSLYVEAGVVKAQRTAWYVAIWALAYLMTQVFGMIGAAIPLVHTGLLAGAFTTAMLTAVSVLILVRYLQLKKQLPKTQLAG